MEIARTSLWGFYCRKGTSWTQITTNWEHLCGLKMIKSWRFHFSKQKRSAIGQTVWTLFSYYLVKKYIFLTELSYQQLSEELSPIIYSNHLSKVNLMIPSLRKLTWTLSIFFLVVLNTTLALCTYRIKHLAHFFFHLISFKELQNLKTAEGKLNQRRIRPSSC